MPTSITTTITEDQKKLFLSIIEAAVTNGGELALHLVSPDKDGIEKLLERKEQFSAAVMRRLVIATRMIAAKNLTSDEEVPSKFGYLVGLKQVHMGIEQLKGFQPKPIKEQLIRLKELIPGLGTADETIAGKPLPEGAESYFAIPRWEKVAPTYGEAVEKILELIDKYSPDRIFNYRKDKLGTEYIREYEPSRTMWEKLTEAQGDKDILIVPAQFGLRHRGRSFRRAREYYTEGEFGLGLYAVAVMLLTHPERLRDYDDLWIECPGDEYSPDADGRFVAVPLIYHYRGVIEVDIYDYVRAKIGSVTAFLTR